ncbi:hypothetical protein ES332_D06G101200v1 [Gossypium tomentosum]|uniref:Uncharacterized protein n=1 Tax=Gossypium tomentosum TaxID=34277 RepID=A0A5D2KG59_GOSTO|nr:hypothetical protein ES332_D06G101200v1 [Gossypium tomentosum]TYH66122.1 hypothetical protein ES332_D06G101200v1 [Gossypium tomentosum]
MAETEISFLKQEKLRLQSKIELKTSPADFRFPTTNQTRHCFTCYIEFHRCLAAKGEESNQCERFVTGAKVSLRIQEHMTLFMLMVSLACIKIR